MIVASFTSSAIICERVGFVILERIQWLKMAPKADKQKNDAEWNGGVTPNGPICFALASISER